MNVDNAFSRNALLAIVLAIIIVGLLSWSGSPRTDGPRTDAFESSGSGSVFFSPQTNLEDSDTAAINSAHSTIDVAMYAFTDPTIETSLASAANRGVRIRIYRDALQLSDEEARSSKHGGISVTDRLRGLRGIEIKLKARGQSMHLKTFCVDRKLLRTGSANWSFQGESAQDNDVYFITDPALVHKFESEFDQVWDRPSNSIP